MTHFPADLYHPHYPSKDNDLAERYHAGARRFANPLLLAFAVYSDAEIEAANQDLNTKRKQCKN